MPTTTFIIHVLAALAFISSTVAAPQRNPRVGQPHPAEEQASTVVASDPRVIAPSPTIATFSVPAPIRGAATTEILSTQSAIVPASGGVEGHIPTGVRSGMTGRLVNNCPYDVYAWTDADPAACGGFCSSPVVKVSANGGSYTAAYKPVMQQGGTTMKVQLVPGPKSLGALNGQPPIYQVEYAVSNNQVHTGLLWYNLSPVDGSPFDGKHRSLQGPGSCHKLECDDGQDYHDCDWWADPTQANREMNVEVCDTGVDLRTPQEIVAVLC